MGIVLEGWLAWCALHETDARQAAGAERPGSNAENFRIYLWTRWIYGIFPYIRCSAASHPLSQMLRVGIFDTDNEKGFVPRNTGRLDNGSGTHSG